MKSIKSYITILVSVFYLFSCQTNPESEINKPLAIAKSNEINIICDKSVWNSPVGDTLSYYFESPYPITPNPEPLFNLRYFTYEQIDAEILRRQLRTYLVLVNLSDTSSAIFKMFVKDIGKARFEKLKNEGTSLVFGKDKWARDQLVLYLAGNGHDGLVKNIEQNFNKITDKVHEHDSSQIYKTTYFNGESPAIQREIKDVFGFNIKIPNEYKKALLSTEESFIWMRKDSRKSIINFMTGLIDKKDYYQNGDYDIVKIIDKLGKNVTASEEGSVMVANNEDAPTLKFDDTIAGIGVKEYRGIWEMTKDFMGGPYFLMIIDNPDTDIKIFFLGFLYGPGDDKKEYLQQMMQIAHTIEPGKH